MILLPALIDVRRSVVQTCYVQSCLSVLQVVLMFQLEVLTKLEIKYLLRPPQSRKI